MKRMLLPPLCALLVVSTASFAQIPGSIGVYADSFGTDCNIQDDGDYITVHMLHVLTSGATASQFMLDVSATSWVYIGETWNFELVIGQSITGVSIAYQECLSGTIYLGSATFQGSSAPPCTQISIVADPAVAYGKIQAADCDWPPNRMFPTGGRANINADLKCQCSLPVEETTWGRVKSLYR
jgi:hypothetical protein